MELDKRIKEGKRPLTCFDIDEAEKYVGQKCYISNEYDFFRNLDFTQLKILNGVEDCEVPFHYEHGNQAEFCLPCEWVKEPEKKFRPFLLNEFLNQYHLGDEIIVRRKLNKDRSIHKLFTEYGENDDTVHLGTYWFTFKDLYDNYEIFKDGCWQPFGVIEDD